MHIITDIHIINSCTLRHETQDMENGHEIEDRPGEGTCEWWILLRIGPPGVT